MCCFLFIREEPEKIRKRYLKEEDLCYVRDDNLIEQRNNSRCDSYGCKQSTIKLNSPIDETESNLILPVDFFLQIFRVTSDYPCIARCSLLTPAYSDLTQRILRKLICIDFTDEINLSRLHEYF